MRSSFQAISATAHRVRRAWAGKEEIMYPTIEEQEAIVKWEEGKVWRVEEGQGRLNEFGVLLQHSPSFFSAFGHEEKRQYFLAKALKKGDHVRVGLNELGIL